MVELEAHERLDERGLAIRLVADHQDGGRVEGLVKLLRHVVELGVRLVEPFVALGEEPVGGAVHPGRVRVVRGVPDDGCVRGRHSRGSAPVEGLAHGLIDGDGVAELLDHVARHVVGTLRLMMGDTMGTGVRLWDGFKRDRGCGKGSSCGRKI